jgi:hypothetical protein
VSGWASYWWFGSKRKESSEQKLLADCQASAARNWDGTSVARPRYEANVVIAGPARAFSSLSPVSSALEDTIKQLKFLLASAPMINVPESPTEAREWVRRAGTAFAYIHPATMAKITFESLSHKSFMVFGKGPTKWVLTSLMPKERVIFSPLAIPGLEKILAE